MKKILITLVVLASLVLAACGSTPTPAAEATQTPWVITATAQPTATPSPTPFLPTTPTPVIVSPTTGPAAAAQVVTATGMSDIGQLLGAQPMTPVPGDLIDWDHLKKMSEWTELPGLAGGVVLYLQSGTPNRLELPPMPGTNAFEVPAGTTLVFGGFTVGLVLESGKEYSFSNGFYGALTEGTKLRSLTVQDGFILLAVRDHGQKEYCARIAQAINEKWAMDHLYRPMAWAEPVCEGVITTPLDNDR